MSYDDFREIDSPKLQERSSEMQIPETASEVFHSINRVIQMNLVAVPGLVQLWFSVL